ncbi:hypothetical protein [Bifidobacterium cuniculi]|uniref:Uncharacterized protein n=1 Tax=Bifidobacterium cuniculi TaxID=1688 RepID=A0A087B417_9BIFI|nr:hypothetical protein [Bifidobacterium cuniculi]KFI65767.1 hypothetical protein BCUN_0262 [Bifidobacterium cuniculi]
MGAVLAGRQMAGAYMNGQPYKLSAGPTVAWEPFWGLSDWHTRATGGKDASPSAMTLKWATCDKCNWVTCSTGGPDASPSVMSYMFTAELI